MPAADFRLTPRRRRSSTAQPQNTEYGNRGSRLLALPALALAGLLCWHMVNMGLASAWYFKANHYLDLWVKNEQLFTEPSWQEASTAIDKAVQLHPTHPHYLLIKAKINEWGWYGGLMTSKQLEQTESYYRQAIALRPTWPNAYADYAYYLGVTQYRVTEALQQLDQAWKLGPFATETHLRQLAVGFRHWNKLAIEQKAKTLSALKLAVSGNYSGSQQALQITRNTGLEKLACIYLMANESELSFQEFKKVKKDFCKNQKNN
ncbi:hypothetical protein [Rheinheimera sp.]|uniref:hypothetical protein n=1 Tax=Rheinheimera sp. TaxID=1869214 RepID=UPI00307E7E90